MTAAKDARYDIVLQRTGILHLVNIDVDKAPRPAQSQFRLRKQLSRPHDEVCEIHSMEFMHALVIFGRNARPPILPALIQLLVITVGIIYCQRTHLRSSCLHHSSQGLLVILFVAGTKKMIFCPFFFELCH